MGTTQKGILQSWPLAATIGALLIAGAKDTPGDSGYTRSDRC